MSKKDLTELHRRVGTILNLTLSNYETRQKIIREHYDELEAQLSDLDELGVSIDLELLKQEQVPHALLNTAIAFLKNNDITVEPEMDDNINNLRTKLGKKRTRISDIAFGDEYDA